MCLALHLAETGNRGGGGAAGAGAPRPELQGGGRRPSGSYRTRTCLGQTTNIAPLLVFVLCTCSLFARQEAKGRAMVLTGGRDMAVNGGAATVIVMKKTN